MGVEMAGGRKGSHGGLGGDPQRHIRACGQLWFRLCADRISLRSDSE